MARRRAGPVGLTSPVGQTEPVRGEATFSAAGGYARLVLKLAEDVESEVSTAGSILVIRFKRPVDIPVDKLSDAVPDYVGSARRDPDGSAIRLSLARRVTVNTMTAGERMFVDLLPDSWTGPPPALPAEVVRELSERARAAERALAPAARGRRRPRSGRRSGSAPRCSRPSCASCSRCPTASASRRVLNDQKLTLLFNAALNFDLADAKLAAPPNIASINQKVERRNFRGRDRADRRCRRALLPRGEELHHRRRLPAAGKAAGAAVAGSPMPRTLRQPGRRAAVARPEPADAAAAAPAEIAPPTSETIAEQAKIEIKPDAGAEARARGRIAASRRRSDAGQGRRRRRRPRTPPAEAAGKASPPRSRRSRRAAESSRLPPAKRRSAAGARRRRLPPRSAAGGVQRRRRQGGRRGRPPPSSARRDSDGLRADVRLCRGDARRRCSAAPTRCGWCSTTPKPIDIEPIRAKGGALHRRCQPAAAGQGPGDPHPPQPAANAFAERRRPRAARAGRSPSPIRCRRRRCR